MSDKKSLIVLSVNVNECSIGYYLSGVSSIWNPEDEKGKCLSKYSEINMKGKVLSIKGDKRINEGDIINLHIESEFDFDSEKYKSQGKVGVLVKERGVDIFKVFLDFPKDYLSALSNAVLLNKKISILIHASKFYYNSSKIYNLEFKIDN